MGINASNESTEQFSRETFAGGLLVKKSNPVWLSAEDKFTLFKAVEEFISRHKNIDAALALLGLTRQFYYGHIWLTPDQAEAFETKLAEASAPPEQQHEGNGEAQKKYRAPTASEKLRKIEAVSTERYINGLDFDEACRVVGITRQRFYDWSSKRSQLLEAVRRGDEQMRRPRGERHGRRGRQASGSVDPETLALRTKIVDEIHADVQSGIPIKEALRERNISRNKYIAWAEQTEHGVLTAETLIDVWRPTQTGDDREAAKQKMVQHLTPTARRIARRYATLKQQRLGFTVDEDELLSHALFEGIYLHIDKFDPERGTPIASYFSTKIVHKVLDDLRNQDWVPRKARALQSIRASLIQEFMLEHSRTPRNDDELADAAPPHHREAAVSVTPMMNSLDASYVDPRNKGQWEDPDGWSMYDVLPSDEGSQDREMRRISDLADDVLSKTHGVGRAIMTMYHLQDMTMKEIGVVLELSESRVSQIHTETVERLRAIAESNRNWPKLLEDVA